MCGPDDFSDAKEDPYCLVFCRPLSVIGNLSLIFAYQGTDRVLSQVAVETFNDSLVSVNFSVPMANSGFVVEVSGLYSY